MGKEMKQKKLCITDMQIFDIKDICFLISDIGQNECKMLKKY